MQELTLPRHHQLLVSDLHPDSLERIFAKTYERAPGSFQEILEIQGVGPKAVRALALIAELLHGVPSSLRDPARYAFAHGGKDGTPSQSTVAPTTTRSRCCGRRWNPRAWAIRTRWTRCVGWQPGAREGASSGAPLPPAGFLLPLGFRDREGPDGCLRPFARALRSIPRMKGRPPV